MFLKNVKMSSSVQAKPAQLLVGSVVFMYEVPRLLGLTSEVNCQSYASSLSERRVTAACMNLPQLKLSRLGMCSRALRIAISEIASTTHSKFA